ncbi:MAG: 16S rRNA (cytosine(1402)-N(4))-methyltransferase RsmH [Gemmatimonadetes bacterium]|nr:16S rRNA (cytosine(1402)-N(4))-methyltransferase RsmH [Gemmatimonadota bacterium]
MQVTVGAFDAPYHAPVLVAEVLQLLGHVRSVLDGTLGGGGHSAALIVAGARVTALDRDPEAIAAARARLADAERAGQFEAVCANFADVDAVPALAGRTFDGILLDLGVSSHQLDDTRRGFTFREGSPLDMRMGADATVTAAEWLNGNDEPALAQAFREYADEHKAMRLARVIGKRRANHPFATSDDLVGAIREALGARSGPSDFARLFQAVRIAVNDEIAALGKALPVLRDRLAPGGVMAVIAYHSGEDRLVKHAFRAWSEDCTCPPRLPRCACGGNRALGAVVTRRAVTAGAAEAGRNARARSARLRGWRRKG